MDLLSLILTALWLGFFHTLLGPDHYLPFVVLKTARGWSMTNTLVVAALCGIGHIASSVLIGLVGIWAGYELGLLSDVESTRGEWAARGLLAFGMFYLAYGIWSAVRNRPHSHSHYHVDGTFHEHHHDHQRSHAHAHGDARTLTPWVLFIIFVLGPCEPLIPLLILPAAQIGALGIAWVATAFAVATLTTMLAVTFLLSRGAALLPLRRAERYAHALAGGAITATGVGMVFFGL